MNLGKLNDYEVAVLLKIAEKSGMDCWFWIKEGNQIYDAESGNFLSYKEGIGLLVQGMTSFDDYELTNEEILTLKMLLLDCKIPPKQWNHL